MGGNFKELLNGKGAASCLELPSSVKWRRYDRKKWKQQCTRSKKARRQGQMKCG